MSISATSAASVSPAVTALALFKLANGEYSAGSVATNPAAANKLGLTKVKDGNYASPLFVGFSSLASTSPAASSSFGIQSALNNLVLGG